MRPRGLKVEEPFGVDLCETLGLPGLGEVPACERGALAAVVPTAESRDQNRLTQRGPADDAEFVSDRSSLRSAARTGSRARPCRSTTTRLGRRGRAPGPRGGVCAIAARPTPSERAARRTRRPRTRTDVASDRGGRRDTPG